jgi:hypothetical protein
MKIGDKVFLTENTRVLMGFEDGLEFEVVDTLNLDVPHPIVVKCDNLGKDWVEFFSEDELILID